jgi:hypothetical protein
MKRGIDVIESEHAIWEYLLNHVNDKQECMITTKYLSKSIKGGIRNTQRALKVMVDKKIIKIEPCYYRKITIIE